MQIVHRSTIKWVVLLSIIIIGEVVTTSLTPRMSGKFFTALEAHSNTIWIALFWLIVNSSLLELFQSFKSWAVTNTQIHARAHITRTLYPLASHMTTGAQRIQEDIKLYLQNNLTAITEIVISSLIVVILVFMNLNSPKLIASVVIYTLLVIVFAKLFNKPMREAENKVQESETLFRDELRTNRTINTFVKTTYANIYANKIRLFFTLFSRSVNIVLYFIPYVVLIPFFLNGTITLGDFMQVTKTFTLCVINTTIVVTLYPTLTVSQACYDRIQELRSKVL